jgi:hypothetical protein
MEARNERASDSFLGTDGACHSGWTEPFCVGGRVQARGRRFSMSFHVPERYRVRIGKMASTEEFGNNGAFTILLKNRHAVFVIASDGLGWEHVSVSRKDRIPTWEEMCQVKALFWDDEDCVVQFHPPESEYVNNHVNCLHLWRPTEDVMPIPESILVGIRKTNQP